MSRFAIVLVALVAAPAAAAVGYWHGKTDEVTVVQPAIRTNVPLVGKPGQGVAEAGKYFAALNAPPPPPKPVVTAPAGPPPPDVALLFRRDLSAVLTGPGGDARVVLAGSRTLRPGQTYQDGWKLASLTPSTATLSKGKEKRTIGLFSPPPASMVAAALAPPPASVGPITLTNGVQGGRMAPAKVAAILSSLRAARMNQTQLDRITTMLQSGTMDASAVSILMSQLGRNGPITLDQARAVANAFLDAGVIQPGMAQNMANQAVSQQNVQNIQQVMQMGGQNNNGRGPGGGGGGGGGRGGGGRPPNAGFGGPPVQPFATPPPPPALPQVINR